jgi:hypothetical protein
MRAFTQKFALLLALVLGHAPLAGAAVSLPATGALAPDQIYLVDSATLRVRGIGLEVVDALLAEGVTEIAEVDLTALKAKLQSMNVVLSVVPGTLWEEGQLVDALNYPGENLVMMSIEALFATPSKRAIRLLVLHEAMGLMRNAHDPVSIDKGYVRSVQIELAYAERFDREPYRAPKWLDPNHGVSRNDVMAYLFEKRSTGLICRTQDGYDASASAFFQGWLAGSEPSQYARPSYRPVEKAYEPILRTAIEYHAILKGWWKRGAWAKPQGEELAEALAFARFEADGAKTSGRVTLQFTGQTSVQLIQEKGGQVNFGTWSLIARDAIEVRVRGQKWRLRFEASGRAPLHRYSLVREGGLEFVHRLESCAGQSQK